MAPIRPCCIRARELHLRAADDYRTRDPVLWAEHLDLRVQRQRSIELIEHLGARRFLPECLSLLAMALMVEGCHAEAVAISLESDAGRSFSGPWALGTLPVVATDAHTRARALSEGEANLASGCVSHNHLWSHRDAIEATPRAGDWDAALRHAAALEAYTAAEPLGWCNLYIALARCRATQASQARTMPPTPRSRR